MNHKGVQVSYSGHKGEMRSGEHGKEFIFLAGTLPTQWSLRIRGPSNGSAHVTLKYRWGYYHSANGASGSALKSKLHDVIDGHSKKSYRSLWRHLARTDRDPENPGNVLGIYSRHSFRGGGYSDGWNREHVWAKSHGDFGTSYGAGTDIHHLRPSDTVVNSERNNYDFKEGGSQLSNAGARAKCPLCKKNSGARTFEPPDEVKGMTARMVFYMATRYNGDSDSGGKLLNVVNGRTGRSGSPGKLGDLATLKRWNRDFPPTGLEQYRNSIAYEIQGNRNPFIDHPEWVDQIW